MPNYLTVSQTPSVRLSLKALANHEITQATIPPLLLASAVHFLQSRGFSVAIIPPQVRQEDGSFTWSGFFVLEER